MIYRLKYHSLLILPDSHVAITIKEGMLEGIIQI